MGSKQMKLGAAISYVMIVANTMCGMLFTPFLLSHLGSGEYGVYKTISSLTNSIAILDLGIGSTMLRYISKFSAEKNKKDLENFSAMGFIEAGILSFAILAVCGGVFFFLEPMYGEALTDAELLRAKQLYGLFAILLVIHVFEKVIFSIIAGHEYFGFANSMRLATLVLKIGVSVPLLLRIPNSLVLAVVDIAVLCAVMVAQLLFIRNTIGLKIHLYYWDKKLFASSGKYTALMFIQSIAVQFNSNLDNIVIGSVEGARSVAVYSCGLQLYAMYEQFAMAFSDLMLPSVSKQIASGCTNRDLEDTVIKVGRLEFISLGAALCGFIIIGRDFITLWLGEDFLFAWLVGVILMVPTTIPLIQNVSLSILRAKNKIGFRTVAVAIMALFNLVFTIVGVRLFGAIAACIGTAIGILFANTIAMNIYYVKSIGLNVFRIFGGIFSRTWLCLIPPSLTLLVMNQLCSISWFHFGVKVLVFCFIYLILLLAWGFNENEKAEIYALLRIPHRNRERRTQ